jgi:hypothetical protein
MVHGPDSEVAGAGVANIALRCGRNMRCSFRQSIHSDIRTIVTGRTLARRASVVHGRGDGPAGEAAGIGMACIALAAARNVCHRLGKFAGKSIRTVVAGRA